MGIYSLKFIEEAYKSKYAGYFDKEKDDDDDEDDDDDDDDHKKTSVASNASKPVTKHIDIQTLQKISSLAKSTLEDYKQLKKCCDIVDLTYKDDFDDEGRKASTWDIYIQKKPNSFVQIIDGDVFSGYPGKEKETDYVKDRKAFVKSVNDKIQSMGIKGVKFISTGSEDDEAVSFGVKAVAE